MSESGIPLISDFGISSMLSATMTFQSTSGAMKGCARFMAREHLTFGDPGFSLYTKKTDVWAFGMTIYASIYLSVIRQQMMIVYTR